MHVRVEKKTVNIKTKNIIIIHNNIVAVPKAALLL